MKKSIIPRGLTTVEGRADYPDMMVNGYDTGQTITNKELYDLKAIPTFYLLDRKKPIILKDAPIERVEEYMIFSRGIKDKNIKWLYPAGSPVGGRHLPV